MDATVSSVMTRAVACSDRPSRRPAGKDRFTAVDDMRISRLAGRHLTNPRRGSIGYDTRKGLFAVVTHL
jgi:hypothetical protein